MITKIIDLPEGPTIKISTQIKIVTAIKKNIYPMFYEFSILLEESESIDLRHIYKSWVEQWRNEVISQWKMLQKAEAVLKSKAKESNNNQREG